MIKLKLILWIMIYFRLSKCYPKRKMSKVVCLLCHHFSRHSSRHSCLGWGNIHCDDANNLIALKYLYQRNLSEAIKGYENECKIN